MPGSRSAVLRKVVRSAAEADRTTVTDRELLRAFARDNDQTAFEVLVTRHTGMVLGVCRRVLLTVQDAEDACQATFLVLANRAADGRWDESVANWLYTTARKVAHNARVAAERRAKREAGAAVPESVEPVDRMTGRELLAALDSALDGLPARYREPLVLCYLEGLTRDEAAVRLGVPLATLHTRIDRARKRLHEALTKAGCALGAGLLALAITSPAGASPPRLVQSILATASGRAPAAVDELAKGVAVNGLFNKTVLALAVVALAALGAGLGSLATSSANPPSDAPAPAAEEKAQPKALPAPPKPAKEVTVSGRVFDPDGKPLAGAKLFDGRTVGPVEVGASDADGKFKVTIPATNYGAYIIARADGVGMDFLYVPPDRLGDEVQLRTVEDHAIRGRIVDTQGKPVAGVSVLVTKLAVYPNNSLDGFLAEWKVRNISGGVKGLWWTGGVLPAITTDKDGRFEIKGTGAERVVTLRVRAVGIAESELTVVNREKFDPKPHNEAKPDPFGGGMPRFPQRLDGPKEIHGPDLALVAEAEKRIRGTVTDVNTGKPRAGVKVTFVRDDSEMLPLPLSAVTDANGRYDIRGARKSASYTVKVDSDPDSRHVGSRVVVRDTAGYEPITADIKTKKGIVITGKVIDAGTKKPTQGFASVAPLFDNKFVKDYPEGAEFAGIAPHPADADGTFRVVTVPGPVILMGGASGNRDVLRLYKKAVPDPDYPKYFEAPQNLGWTMFVAYDGRFHSVRGQFCKVFELKADAETVTQDVILEPAK